MNNNIKHNMRHDIYNIMQSWKLDKKRFITLIGLAMIVNIANLLLPQITSLTYKQIELNNIHDLYIYGGLGVLLRIFLIFFVMIRDWFLEGFRYMINTKKYIYYRDLLVQKDISQINDFGTGKIMTKFNQGVDAESDIFKIIINSGLLITMRGGVSIYILASYDYRILFLLIPGFALLYFILQYFNKIHEKINKKINDIYSEGGKINIRLISELLLIKVNNKTKYENNKFENIYNPLTKLKQQSDLYGNVFYNVFNIVIESIIIFVIVYIGLQIIGGTNQISTIILLTGYIYVLRRPLQNFLTALPAVSENLTKYHELQSFLNTPNKIINGKTQYIYKSGNINLQNVNFGYNEDRKILENMNMNFPSGKTTALVGHSGSGKSTIIKLLLRLYDTDNGNIYIDNQNICDLDISTLYNHVGYLTQEPAIFDGTIRENLMYGLYDDIQKTETGRDVQLEHVKTDNNQSENSSNIYNSKNNIENKYSLTSEEIEERLRNGLKLAKADELVAGLKDGLDTEIGEKGIKLSGGERQRIAIARIFVKNPSILILDEPTSALDSISEHAITEAINTLMCNKTVIIIAHRLQTVMHADNIYVMESGKIIESGKHMDLINKGGIYSELIDLQSGLIKE